MLWLSVLFSTDILVKQVVSGTVRVMSQLHGDIGDWISVGRTCSVGNCFILVCILTLVNILILERTTVESGRTTR